MARSKDQERFKVTPFKNLSGAGSWRVTGRMPDGRRVRKNFTDKAQALLERNELELEAAGYADTHQTVRTILTPAQVADAEAAAQQAEGGRLSQIVSHYMALRQRARDKGVDLDQAIAFVEARYCLETKDITVFNAREEFLKSKGDMAPATRRNYKGVLGALLKPDPNRLVHDFAVTDLEQVMARYENLNTRKTLRRVFSVFFNWAERHHYCLENPCRRLEKLPADTSKIAILTLDEVTRLLHITMQYRGGVTTASVAIALFSGLRPSELAALKPKDIRDDKIIVRGGKMRRIGNRRAPVPEILKVWLKEFPFEGLPSGWDYKLRQLKALTKADKWVPDILRHTSISYQAERDKDEAKTAFNNGTSKKMMDNHYRELIDDEKIVETFWELTPQNVRREKLKVDMPSRKRADWPSKSRLKKLVWQKPLIHIADDIGVSNVALKKHCVGLGIELPPRGHWLKS